MCLHVPSQKLPSLSQKTSIWTTIQVDSYFWDGWQPPTRSVWCSRKWFVKIKRRYLLLEPCRRACDLLESEGGSFWTFLDCFCKIDVYFCWCNMCSCTLLLWLLFDFPLSMLFGALTFWGHAKKTREVHHCDGGVQPRARLWPNYGSQNPHRCEQIGRAGVVRGRTGPPFFSVCDHFCRNVS